MNQNKDSTGSGYQPQQQQMTYYQSKVAQPDKVSSLRTELAFVEQRANKQSSLLLKQKISECFVYFKEKLKAELASIHHLDVHLASLFTEGKIQDATMFDLSDVPGLNQCLMVVDWEIGPNTENFISEIGLQRAAKQMGTQKMQDDHTINTKSFLQAPERGYSSAQKATKLKQNQLEPPPHLEFTPRHSIIQEPLQQSLIVKKLPTEQAAGKRGMVRAKSITFKSDSDMDDTFERATLQPAELKGGLPNLPPAPSREMATQANINQLSTLHQNIFKLIQNEEILERQRISRLALVKDNEALLSHLKTKFTEDRETVNKQITTLTARYNQLYSDAQQRR